MTEGPSWTPPVSLEEIEAARRRIAPYIRQTPLLEVGSTAFSPPQTPGLRLKLENLQVTGAFKARGALNCALLAPRGQAERGLITASGGNHGLAVAYAAKVLSVPATVYLPANAPEVKAERLRRLGAKVVRHGEVWDDADAAARERAGEADLLYIHPFAEPAILAGQGTLGLEILEQEPDVDLLLVAIGGGGLIAGVASAITWARPAVPVVGIEPTGAPTLTASVAAGRVVILPEVTTAANTLAPRSTADLNLDVVRHAVAEIVLVDDEEMREAARWLWNEVGVAAELSGAAAVAALRSGCLGHRRSDVPVAIVCGVGTDGLSSAN
jgi:threonine dehydratase